MQEIIEYIRANKLDSSDIVKSILNRKKRTEKQDQVLRDKVAEHKKIFQWFGDNHYRLNNTFYASLHKQFTERGFLTKKQRDCILPRDVITRDGESEDEELP